jgi:hypothetical protein
VGVTILFRSWMLTTLFISLFFTTLSYAQTKGSIYSISSVSIKEELATSSEQASDYFTQIVENELVIAKIETTDRDNYQQYVELSSSNYFFDHWDSLVYSKIYQNGGKSPIGKESFESSFSNGNYSEISFGDFTDLEDDVEKNKANIYFAYKDLYMLAISHGLDDPTIKKYLDVGILKNPLEFIQLENSAITEQFNILYDALGETKLSTCDKWKVPPRIFRDDAKKCGKLCSGITYCNNYFGQRFQRRSVCKFSVCETPDMSPSQIAKACATDNSFYRPIEVGISDKVSESWTPDGKPMFLVPVNKPSTCEGVCVGLAHRLDINDEFYTDSPVTCSKAACIRGSQACWWERGYRSSPVKWGGNSKGVKIDPNSSQAIGE